MFDIDVVERHIAAYAETVKDVDWSNVDTSLAVRVDRGYSYLSTVYGDELSRINLGRLRIQSDDACILGQLWGSYGMSPELHQFSVEWLVAHGFVPSDYVIDDGEPDGDKLNDLWRAVLLVLRGRK